MREARAASFSFIACRARSPAAASTGASTVPARTGGTAGSSKAIGTGRFGIDRTGYAPVWYISDGSSAGTRPLTLPATFAANVDTPVAQYLVLAHTRYPGWEATLDGSPAPILDANTAFMALDVPAGRHSVEFTYRPRSFHFGLLLAGFGAILGILLSAFRRGNDG